ncbi:VOC family protein [Christensenella intestinihominis]|uniref:VOC family protein n=1 Tax=Christensenella intestinihominis TaxID=1851429 RepID=UPI00082D67F5|nr:VOC family protein [Christensenella intestinihominis]
MLKNRKHDHIGLATDDIDATVAWYTEVLGFELYGECIAPDGTPCKFLRGNGINYEVFQPVSGVGESVRGKIDHISFVSDDIEKDYEYSVKMGYPCTTGGIQDMESAWENGCRYFKIKSPTGEEIEFDQIL